MFFFTFFVGFLFRFNIFKICEEIDGERDRKDDEYNCNLAELDEEVYNSFFFFLDEEEFLNSIFFNRIYFF